MENNPSIIEITCTERIITHMVLFYNMVLFI